MMRVTNILGASSVLLAQRAAAEHVDQAVLTNSGPASLVSIPSIGFGTWNIAKEDAAEAVSTAIEVGYRHIDGAFIYGNEKEVGQGIKDGLKKASIKREDIWITSKLWNDRHAPEDVPKALDKSLEDLGLDYLDLYIMHWPVAFSADKKEINYVETYTAMVKLPTTKTRHIGISNFSPTQLSGLVYTNPGHLPYVHQYESHPYLPQDPFLATHNALQIQVTAYSPLGNTNPTYNSARKEHAAEAVPPLLSNDVVKDVAKERGCTTAQVALAWGLSRGTSVIPKSTNKEHIKENFEALDKCKLRKADLDRLKELPIKRFNNPSKAWGVQLYQGLQDSGQVLAEAGERMKQYGANVLGLERLRSAVEAFVERYWRTMAPIET